MKKVILIISIVSFLSCCGRKADQLSDSVSSNILLLYSDSNPRLRELATKDCDLGCQSVLNFAQNLKQASEELMIQSCGMNEDGKFIAPYRKGQVAISILENHNLYQSAIDLVDKLNARDSLPDQLAKLKNIIDYDFSNDAGTFSKNRMEQIPISFACLEILVLENFIYTTLIHDK